MLKIVIERIDFIMATIATHNGSVSNRDHNIRNPKVVAKQSHIDPNGHFEIWIDEKPRDAYKRIFGDALKEYNAKQTREDRKIKDYYNHICKDKKKHPVYEMIIGVYDSEVPENVKRGIMKQFVDEWNERNPNLELIGAYYHNDEQGQNGGHTHLCYVCKHSSNSRGLKLQSGMVKALGEQGFHKVGKLTAQIQWEARENQYLGKLCIARGVNVEHPHRENVEHLETEVYKLTQKNDELQGLNKKYEDLKLDTVDKTLFGKPKETVTLSYSDYQTLNRLAEQTKNIEEREKALIIKEEEVRDREVKANIKMTHLRSIEKDILENQRRIKEIVENLEKNITKRAKELNSGLFEFLKEHNLLPKWKESTIKKDLQKAIEKEKNTLQMSFLNGDLSIDEQLNVAGKLQKLEEQLENINNPKSEIKEKKEKVRDLSEDFDLSL